MHRREFIAALAGTVTGAHSLTPPAASASKSFVEPLGAKGEAGPPGPPGARVSVLF